jgi:hypothetical protein
VRPDGQRYRRASTTMIPPTMTRIATAPSFRRPRLRPRKDAPFEPDWLVPANPPPPPAAAIPIRAPRGTLACLDRFGVLSPRLPPERIDERLHVGQVIREQLAVTPHRQEDDALGPDEAHRKIRHVADALDDVALALDDPVPRPVQQSLVVAHLRDHLMQRQREHRRGIRPRHNLESTLQVSVPQLGEAPGSHFHKDVRKHEGRVAARPCRGHGPGIGWDRGSNAHC